MVQGFRLRARELRFARRRGISAAKLRCKLRTTMKPLASRLSVLTGEGALTVYLRAKDLEPEGRSIIHLEPGEPDFHPAEPVIAALEKAVRDGKDRYCPMAGLPALKEEISAYLRRTRNIKVSPENVVIAPGCKLSLF